MSSKIGFVDTLDLWPIPWLVPSINRQLNAVPSVVRISSGQIAFEGGVDGGRVPLLATTENPTGLKFNQLAWAVNGTVRGGGITPRRGWSPVFADFAADSRLFQGVVLYQPDAGYPYLIFAAGGYLYKLTVQGGFAIENITPMLLMMALNAPQFWFCQAEKYLIIQDGVSVPRVWDGTSLQLITAIPGADPAKMLPVGEAMDYYMGRVWVAQGREYVAGDIVGGPTGTAPERFRDAVLHMTENNWLLGGGKFTVPTVAGDIRALAHTANLDTALGEGQLFVFTRNTIYSVNVPTTRSEWAQLTQPLQRVAQQRYGAVSERSIVPVNGDLFYQAYDGVRSLMLAIRYYNQWGQTPISRNVNRILQFNDRALLRYISGIEFDNRLLMTSLPKETPLGVASQAVMPLDFDLITSLNERIPPVWEGHWEGIDILQLVEGDWGGLQRAFAFAVSRQTGRMQIWEIGSQQLWDNTDDRVTMLIEFPGHHWNNVMQLKQLDNGELWIDKLYGTVNFEIDYRPDQYPCWIPWYKWSECSARTTCEDVINPVCYPEQGYRDYCEDNKITIVLPKAPADVCTGNQRPSDWGYSFQVRLRVKGYCRVRGLLLWAIPRQREPYRGIRNTI